MRIVILVALLLGGCLGAAPQEPQPLAVEEPLTITEERPIHAVGRIQTCPDLPLVSCSEPRQELVTIAPDEAIRAVSLTLTASYTFLPAGEPGQVNWDLYVAGANGSALRPAAQRSGAPVLTIENQNVTLPPGAGLEHSVYSRGVGLIAADEEFYVSGTVTVEKPADEVKPLIRVPRNASWSGQSGLCAWVIEPNCYLTGSTYYLEFSHEVERINVSLVWDPLTPATEELNIYIRCADSDQFLCEGSRYSVQATGTSPLVAQFVNPFDHRDGGQLAVRAWQDAYIPQDYDIQLDWVEVHAAEESRVAPGI